MGALTSLTKWIPEDDLLLKNAVEAGASLESLAKGAVQFSRRFTIRELRDRWQSLLYDLDTSTEASAQIVKIEIELAALNLPKASRTCNPNSKVKESSSGKRKVDSVRNHYYAMRKRIRSEPCATNLSFLEPSALLAATGCDSGPGNQLKPQIKPPADNFGLEIPFSGDYRHPEAGYDGGQHAFSEQMRVGSAAGNGNVHHQPYHAGHVGAVEGEIPDGASPEGCLFAYPGNLSSAPCDDSECNNGDQSFEHNFQQRDFPHILGENLIDTSADVHEISQPNALAKSSPYKNEDIGDKPLSGFDSPNNNREGVRSDFVRNNSLSSHVQDYGYSSPPSGMPMWRTMEDISTPTMRMDGHYGDKEQGLLNMEDHKNISAPGCGDVSSEPTLDDGMYGGGLHNPTIMPENDSMGFSDSYMDFPDDEILLFIDVNEKDNADRSCLGLSSILLSSPSDTHHGVANAKDLGAENVLETCLGIPDAACSGEPNVACDQTNSGLHNDHNTSVSGVNIASTSSQTSNTAELQEKFMLCVVNRQDLEIPNNDHVIFPPPFSSNQEQSTREITGPVSSDTVLSTDQRDPVGDLNKVKEQVPNMLLTVSLSKESSPRLPKVGVPHSCDSRAVEAESSKGGSIAGGCRDADSAVDEPKPCKSETVGLNSTPIAAMKEEATALCFQNQDNPDTSFASFLENHLQETDDTKIHPLNATDTCPEEASMQVGLKTCLPSPTNVVSAEVGFSDTVAITSTSDQDEQFSDCEDDVPYFSDIESLILDMDLGPYDEESCLISKEVSRYQHIDTKNMVRLEQGFHSRTNRSISSQGAFAVFYGRHLKYFIKEPEVLIGRETADFKVDIDLGREGRANRVSRRQAIIKMDEEGAFSLNNIGKFSIFVNGKEVPAKKRINLLSHSLVKILDMNFTFEVNENAVRHGIKKLRRSSQELNSFKFDLKPDRNF